MVKGVVWEGWAFGKYHEYDLYSELLELAND